MRRVYNAPGFVDTTQTQARISDSRKKQSKKHIEDLPHPSVLEQHFALTEAREPGTRARSPGRQPPPSTHKLTDTRHPRPVLTAPRPPPAPLAPASPACTERNPLHFDHLHVAQVSVQIFLPKPGDSNLAATRTVGPKVCKSVSGWHPREA